MSADNWAECPRCRDEQAKSALYLRQRVDAEFGQIPVDEWRKKDAAAHEFSLQGLDHNFREDYEIYGAESGVIQVDYHGVCQVCHLEISFTDSRSFYDRS